MPITLTGTGFTSDYYPAGQPSLTIYVSPYATGGGVSVTNIVVVNSTTLTCDFVISQTAAAGVRTVKVSTSGGDSGTQPFTVGYPSDFLVFFG